MKRLDKLKSKILKELNGLIDKIKKAEKASSIYNIIDKFDIDDIVIKELKGQYFGTNNELNKFFDEEI